jgi:prophage DNA circulation protein
MEPGSDDRDRIHPNASSPPKTDADVAPLIQKVGAPSIAQIEKLIGELHEARNLLESETERIQREIARYIKFTQMASASVRIISDTLSGWRQAGHPLSQFVTRSAADDSTGRMDHPFGSAPDM